MTEDKVNEVFLFYGKKIADDKQLFFKKALQEADDSKYSAVCGVDLLSPTRTILMSIFLGGLGIDRFYVGDIGFGVGKLLLGWLTAGIWQIIDIFICYKKAKEKNFQKAMLALS